MSTDISIIVRFADQKDLEVCFRFDPCDRQDIIENKIGMHEMIIAERCGETIGYLKLEYIKSTLPYISLISVMQGYRGKGIGSLLLNYAIEFMQINGYNVLLSSSSLNELELQTWLRKKNFVECGMLNGINEDGFGEVFFKLDLKQ